MADVRPFRALRFDASRVDPSATIAPPYDVISPEQQAALYRRDPHNIVRIEYGAQRPGDSPSTNRYTRAADDLRTWRREGVLRRDAAPALYHYRLTFEWAGIRHERIHHFAAVRLEEWDRGVIKPHEHTLSGPKTDRLELLKATRTQVSPVYCLFRDRSQAQRPCPAEGAALYEVDADWQHHALSAIADHAEVASLQERWAAADFYIADGHHRYETALAYRDECRRRARSWSGEEPENFVLTAITDASDPGLLVLPTHRIIHRPLGDGSLDRLGRAFDIEELPHDSEGPDYSKLLAAASPGAALFIGVGLLPGRVHSLRLRDRDAVEGLMPPGESSAWKGLDVNVLQYGILNTVFDIDDADLAAGGAVSYTQDIAEARKAVEIGAASCAFLLKATPVDQVLAVSDANGRMPQKSTYFHPKLPTGLVLNQLD
ncbi:MAG: DUF1015 domain-containing protein [Chloroflexi bacterium]|nr:DUF1015 domain-containing protein [Chloroflexota bacterium]